MADKFVVHKFGGTSVGSADCFAKVADIVSALEPARGRGGVSYRWQAQGHGPAHLAAGAGQAAAHGRVRGHPGHAAQEAPRRGEHAAAARGGRAHREGHRARPAVRLGAAALHLHHAGLQRQRGGSDGKKHHFRFVDARDFLTVEPDNEHGPVVQYDLSTQKMQDILKSGEDGELTHLVVTGFICSTTEGVMTTLKRDGSDFTASICGRVLHASSVTIWTDVSGVLSADPRRVPESQILPEISYQEAMELAYFGAKVIHPKTMAPAIVEDIPIYIRNTFEPEHPGTKISHRKKVELKRTLSNGAPTARNIVSGFSTVDDLALFNIEGSGMVGVHGTSSRLFSALDRVKVNVVLIAQASSEHSICFAVPMDCAEIAKDVINETFFKEIHVGHIDKAEYIAPISIIAAVGDQMNQTPGVCARFFGALGRAKINVLAISQGSSERNISAVVRYEDSAAALRAVHSSFFLSDQTLSIGLMGLEFARVSQAAFQR
ncbi:hypothetical protein ON010_g18063 [Phytophthora cinnamomi]|nr:hypothetical protein ON010_g18063 [Phytophthora cinnamomi]